jgi:hypothetical protein
MWSMVATRIERLQTELAEALAGIGKAGVAQSSKRCTGCTRIL